MSMNLSSALIVIIIGVAAAGTLRNAAESTTPACSTNCSSDLITVSGGFKSDAIDISGGCAVRTFWCDGNHDVTIEINGGASMAYVRYSVTCNAAGTAWEHKGMAVTRLTCSAW